LGVITEYEVMETIPTGHWNWEHDYVIGQGPQHTKRRPELFVFHRITGDHYNRKTCRSIGEVEQVLLGLERTRYEKNHPELAGVRERADDENEDE